MMKPLPRPGDFVKTANGLYVCVELDDCGEDYRIALRSLDGHYAGHTSRRRILEVYRRHPNDFKDFHP